ncbi:MULTISPECIES: CHAT domain-containing protein [Prochlorococcus]|uniref:CHAT domain-containing protein n=1 Tax=Prochlorococcus TaxID=1218 RepID=UPI0007B387A6|nr:MULTISPECIES: CHAT domain-containing protein [Prochlorococcus]KZR67264.1 CHAT domain protein [Prochlorococcus marinus str. MIT 1312]NMO84125.1 CHAT domain-containing protein [Prochlorococcus sp. P1344]NMP12442.1 CHAT domain-containing protein [Prochlorococcus sp.P1363]
MKPFALTVALLMPLATDAALTDKSSQVIPEIYTSKYIALDHRKLGSNDVDRITELNQIAKALPGNGVFVEYQIHRVTDGTKSPEQSLGVARQVALVLKPNGQVEKVDLGLAGPIEEKVQQALRASEERLTDAQKRWCEVSELVVKPLTKATSGSTTWFISPDAQLNRIPFTALSAPQGDGLLADAVKLRLLTTGRELLDLAKTTKTAAQKPLVVANPNFDRGSSGEGSRRPTLLASNKSQQRSADLTSSRWIPLPGTAKEGKAVSELINGQLLMGVKATETAVKEYEAPKVLHFASHSYFLNDQGVVDNPLLTSGIVLAGANYPNINNKEDGYLTALELSKLNLKSTEMVVVSGNESYGLRSAIAVAGARSSLLSLWKVDDAATAAFMQSFYERLKAGEGRADALAATQQEFREHKIPGWRHPYVWAAFQLSGDWKPIQGL